MERVAGVGGARVDGPGVEPAYHLQAGRFEQRAEVVAGAEAEVFGQVGQDQPAFTVRFQVVAEAAQETAEHPPARVVDGVFEA